MSFKDVIGSLAFDEDGADGMNGELVADAVVLLHLVDQESGHESIQIVNTVGMGSYTQLGLVAEAWSIVNRDSEDD